MVRIPNESVLRFCALAAALFAVPSLAEPDTFDLGSGRTGAVTLNDAGTVINRYATVVGAIQAGDSALGVSDPTGFSSSDLVLILQTTGLVPVPPSGDAGPFDLTSTGVGRWELARVAGVDGGTLLLTAPLVSQYPASLTQVVQVPEYTDLTLPPGTSIVARPWDGARGGVVALLATGVITNGGTISADQAGFRGGLYQDDVPGGNTGCTSLDQPPPQGALKGEGIAPSLYGGVRSGYGNVANGAGGGDCHDTGGGGGGNAGAGGVGGRSFDGARDVGGRGGAPLVYSLLDHLTLGGGGGAGYGHNSQGTSGGNGGGAIFLRAGALQGSGTISANGGSALSSGANGAGGGGAGGSISVRLAGGAACGAILAQGGDGGNAGNVDLGPGGGGGGGRILLQSAGGACHLSASPGLAGQNGSSGAYGPTYGASPTPQTASAYQGDIVAMVDGGYVAAPPGSKPVQLSVGCGCGAASSQALACAATVLLLGLGWRRKRGAMAPRAPDGCRR